MVVDGNRAAKAYVEKLARELRSGLVSLLLLLAIDRTGPDYGYRILKTIREASGGKLELQEGTCYPLLAQLERMQLVTSFWGTGEGGPRRKYYQVTAAGREALGEALHTWRDQVAAVQELDRRLGAPGAPRFREKGR